MKLRDLFLFSAAAAAALVVFAVGRPGCAATYSVVDLGVPAGVDFSEGIDVNEAGQVAVRTWASGYFYGVLWHNGERTVIDIPLPYNAPEAINNLGHIAGHASDNPGHSRGMLWQNGSLTYLPDAPGGQSWTRAHDVNDSGLVVGNSLGDPNNINRAFTWQNGVWNDLGIVDVGFGPGNAAGLPRIVSDAVKVNNAGQILGVTTKDQYIQGDFRFRHRTWILDHGSLAILPTLPGDADASTFPYALNEQGDVLASYNSSINGFFFGIWQGGEIRPLQSLPGTNAFAVALNDSRAAVGFSSVFGPTGSEPTYYATIWDSAGVPIDLNTLVDASGNGWQLTRANAINNKGWIVGQGINPQGQDRGFLLIPVPEPQAIGVCLIALGALLIGDTPFSRCRSTASGEVYPRRLPRVGKTGQQNSRLLTDSRPSTLEHSGS